MAKEEATLLIKIKKVGSEKISQAISLFKTLGAAVTATAGVIAGFVAAGIQAYKKQELAVNQLNQAMVNNGDFTRKASEDMQKFASNMQKVTIHGDETVLSMLSLAKSFGVSNEQAKKMVKASADLSAQTGMSLESAVRNLGKSLSGLSGELGESVKEIRTLSAEQLKSGAAIDLVATKYKDAALAQTQGLGAIDQLKNAMGDFVELIGKAAAPLISKLAANLRDFTTAINENKILFQSMSDVISGTMSVLIKMGKVVWDLGDVVSTVFTTIIASAIAIGTGNWKRAVLTFEQGARDARKIMENFGSVDTNDDDLKNLEDKKNKEIELERQAEIRKREIKAEERNAAHLEEMESELSHKQLMLDAIGASDEQLLQMALKTQEQAYKNAKTSHEKQAALNAMAALKDQQLKLKQAAWEKKQDEEKLKQRQDVLGQIATLQGSSNKTLAVIGKAAALTQIAISAPQGIAKALAAFPPPFNFAAAAAVGAAFAAQAAQVAGIQLAEGGIVPSTPGGIQATIGEGGRSEAVIPLPDNFDPDQGLGGGTTIHFNGPIMGDASQAREFAIALDRELLELRRGNQSVAFDSGVI